MAIDRPVQKVNLLAKAMPVTDSIANTGKGAAFIPVQIHGD
jgi:hypothetical protein